MAEDFNSKYSGEQVEQLLDQVASGNTGGGGGGGGITIETDPIFAASPAATITAEKIAEWDGKPTEQDLSGYAQVVTYSEDKSTGVLGYQNKTLYPNTKASAVQTDDGQTAQDKFGAMVTTFADGLLKDGNGEQFFPLTIAERVTVGDQNLSEYLAGLGSSSGGDSETIVAENSLAPAFLSTGQIKNNEVYILTSNILSLTINNLAFSVHTKDYEKFTMIFTTASSASFDGVSFPADWQWANGVAPNVEKGVTYELSVTYIKFGSSVKYNAILTPFKAV